MSKQSIPEKLFDPSLVKDAIWQSVVKLNPVIMYRNPVMFAVEIGTAIMMVVCIWIATGERSQGGLTYNLLIFVILLVTLLFANFAEAIAEARGKAQAESLRKTREETPAKWIPVVGEVFVQEIRIIPSSQLKKGDVLEVMPPVGKFNTPLHPDQQKNYMAIAAGSGITPVISLIKTTLATEKHSRFTLVFGNRNRNSIIFFEELEALKNCRLASATGPSEGVNDQPARRRDQAAQVAHKLGRFNGRCFYLYLGTDCNRYAERHRR